MMKTESGTRRTPFYLIAVVVVWLSNLASVTGKLSQYRNMSEQVSQTEAVMPVLFLSHGGGPCWYVDGDIPDQSTLKEADKNSKSADFMRNLRESANLPRHPKAILVISAHWEESQFTVMSTASPDLYFDYFGFPDHTYRLEWGVPGAPEVAKETMDLLNQAGIKCVENKDRGLDHGVFVPLKLVYPEADVPVFQLSLKKGLNILEHINLGESLAPLRSKGVLIVGSGQSTHNMHEMGGAKNPDWCQRFRNWFHDVLTNDKYLTNERKRKLLASSQEQTFGKAHPRIEHFLSSVVACAAAGFKPGILLYEEVVFGSMLMSSFKFE